MIANNKLAADNEGTPARALEQMSQARLYFCLITKVELRRIVPYTPQHILRLEKRGLFPRRVRLGANRVGWLLTEIEQWVATRVAERDATALAVKGVQNRIRTK